MLGPTLTEILRRQRDFFNARFALGRRRWPGLEPVDFSLFLRDRLDPLVTAVAGIDEPRAAEVGRAGYELGLLLVAEKLAGPAARHAAIDQTWDEVFPKLATHIAAKPRLVLGSLCNAAHRLATTPGTRSGWWRQKLAGLGPCCADADQALGLAQVLAWRAGLAEYRTTALAVADTLPPPLALAALDGPASAPWQEVLAAHRADPWHGYDPTGRLLDLNGSLRRVGAFRGLGGEFIAPPLVVVANGHLVARSGQDVWIIQADAFGATFHRAAEPEVAGSLPPGIPSKLKLCAGWLPAGHRPTSAAHLNGTVVLTSAHSHTVWVGRLELT